jgi:chromosome segregation ATPase
MDKNYVDYYIELLASTMQDAIIRNISLQANAKLTDIAIGQLNEKVIELENEIEKYHISNNSNEDAYKNKINELNSEISNLNHLKVEYEKVKNQANHVDTFRNELLKSRKENEELVEKYESKIKELNEKINYLQLTPAKRKKILEDKTQKTVGESTNTLDTIIKDGGSF